MLTKPSIGFIQGRLSPVTNNRIQQFPWDTWQNEFSIASKNDINLIEWTIDTFKFYLNPLINLNQWEEINTIAIKNSILIPSVTCDYFMENPPWKSDINLIKKGIIAIFQGMKNISAKILVVPLVDNSSLLDSSNANTVKNLFTDLIPEMIQNNIQIAFECDLNPEELLHFISEFDKNYFGINYDIGNSASLGFDPNNEFEAYGSRITNVHIKDRKFNGPTIPLGEGDADFLRIFGLLHEVNYQGNLMLQTARSKEGKDVEVLVKYKKLVEGWWREAKIG
jgi:L-ribulose-5-phosphate 3-epimerase